MKRYVGILCLLFSFLLVQGYVVAQEKMEKKGEAIEKKGEMKEKRGEKMDARGEKMQKKGEKMMSEGKTKKGAAMKRTGKRER